MNKEQKMDIKNVFKKYDPKSEAVWKEWKDMKFLIAPMGNAHQKKTITEMFTLKEAIGLEEYGALTFEDVKANVAMGKVYRLYAYSLVLDWQDVEEDTLPIKFSHDKIHEWMMEHGEFANWIILEATKLRKEQLEAAEALVKN